MPTFTFTALLLVTRLLLAVGDSTDDLGASKVIWYFVASIDNEAIKQTSLIFLFDQLR